MTRVPDHHDRAGHPAPDARRPPASGPAPGGPPARGAAGPGRPQPPAPGVEPPTRPTGHPAPPRRPAPPQTRGRGAPGARGGAGSRRGIGGGADPGPDDHPASRPPARRRGGAGRNQESRPVDPPVRMSGPGRLLRGLAGVLAGGLVVLAAGLVVVEWLAGRNGVPGPGTGAIAAHLVAAVVAVTGQVVADRRADRTGTLAALGVIGTVALVLGLGWFL
ncbi:hypothetical protein [Pseudonocardia sp. NPDC046786]|uniref:hypothetical protein n=1 Tax=Pseudonocardia sp. NPDC046786 TaxID=3155471 RepID=UPI0033DB9286